MRDPSKSLSIGSSQMSFPKCLLPIGFPLNRNSVWGVALGFFSVRACFPVKYIFYVMGRRVGMGVTHYIVRCTPPHATPLYSTPPPPFPPLPFAPSSLFTPSVIVCMSLGMRATCPLFRNPTPCIYGSPSHVYGPTVPHLWVPRLAFSRLCCIHEPPVIGRDCQGYKSVGKGHIAKIC
jgi:hypothetical protein